MNEERELAKRLEEQCSVAPQPSSSEPSAAAPAEGSSQKQNGRRKEGSGGGGSSSKGAGDEGKKDKKPHARDPRSQSPEVQLSRALAYICRHGAEKEGLAVRPDGYLPLEAVLARPRVRNIKMRPEEKNKKSPPAQEDVLAVVESNDKKRFEVTQEQEGAAWLIRAVQGHSIKEVTTLDHVDLTLDNLNLLNATPGDKGAAVEVLHGTTRDAWAQIQSSGGLKKMKRNHIHLAKGRPGSDGVISGMRASSPIIIHIDVVGALKAGYAFSIASNGAVLSPGKGPEGLLPLDFFSKVEETKTGNVIWQGQGKGQG